MNIGVVAEGNDRLGVFYEGIWRVVRFLSEALIDNNHKITFFCIKRHENELNEFIASFYTDNKPGISIVSDTRVPFEEYIGTTDDESSILLADLVKLSRPSVDVWLNPNPFWRAVRYLQGPKVCLFHDFLLADYPLSYIQEPYDYLRNEIYAAISSHDHFVVLSEYVKQRHATGHFNIPSKKVTTIVTPPIVYKDKIDSYLSIDEGERVALGDRLRRSIRNTLPQWQGSRETELFFHHVSHYPFEQTPYIFVSTQNRPHKNVKIVAHALNILVRQKFESICVFTTALLELRGGTDLEIYLARNHLFGDFMSVGKLDNDAHAAMYAFAAVTVHPSSFEGNFPLPFAESVSLGTPCIMPFSSAFKDFVAEADWPYVFYFNSASSLSEKITDVLSYRDEYIFNQKRVLKKLQENTWEKCAIKYESVFNAVIREKQSQ